MHQLRAAPSLARDSEQVRADQRGLLRPLSLVLFVLSVPSLENIAKHNSFRIIKLLIGYFGAPEVHVLRKEKQLVEIVLIFITQLCKSCRITSVSYLSEVSH